LRDRPAGVTVGKLWKIVIAIREELPAPRPQQMNKQTGYRPDIDGLRAVAVLLVVGYHAFPNVVAGGYVGVDIFFVISGFLITTLLVQDLQRKELSFSRFYARRIRRIFPALALVLFVCFARPDGSFCCPRNSSLWGSPFSAALPFRQTSCCSANSATSIV
jgi:peptidoglycan/LPS O-acetylase OafA/YrhL